MKNIKITLLTIASLIIFQSCYVSKTLDRDVKISLDENFIVSISNTGNSNFISAYSDADYIQAFLEGMKSEFSTGHIIIDNSNPEFAVSIAELTISESTSTETVSDSDSDDNGKVFELTSLNLSSKGIVDQVDGDRIKEWWADKSKDEKVTNNRSAGQVITGSNKDNNTYREKDFSDDIALDLANKCGRRSGARIINDIVKALKNK